MQSQSKSSFLSPSFAPIIQLQQSLCYQRVLILSQNQQKLKFRQEIEYWLKHYYSSYINIIKQTTNNIRIKISDDDIFGNTYNFVKQVVLLLSKDIILMGYLLETQPDDSKLRKLLPSIVNVLYQNCVDDDFVNKDITKLIAKIALKSFERKLNLLEGEAVKEFYNRPECRRYGQIVAKSILLALSSNHPTQQKLEGVKQYTRESFPKMKLQKPQISLVNSEGEQFEYLVKDYFKMILNSEYHVPVCLRVLMKSIDNQKGNVAEEKVVQLLWEHLFEVYLKALKFPDQYIKKIEIKDSKLLQSIELAHKQLASFKTLFSKLKLYNQLDQSNKILVKQFITKLLNVPQNTVQQFDSPPKSELKLYSGCFSVEQTIILLKSLHETPTIKQINQKIATRVSRIREMSQQFSDFCKIAPHNQIYCIFYELSLPKEIDLDYMKKYQQIYTERKLESLIRQILTTIQPLQVYLSSFNVSQFKELLSRIQADPEQQQNGNPDKIAFYVNIKYFLWISKDKNIDQQIKQMLIETQKNHNEWLSLFSKTKIHFTNALYYLKGYSQRTTQTDNKLRQVNLMLGVQQYLHNFSFNLCVSSPTSRQKQFQTSGKLIIMNHERILLQKWQNCVHQKMKLKGQLNQMLHVKNFDEMIEALCHLEEVKNSIENGVDKVGINMNLFWFLSHIFEEATVQNIFKKHSKQFRDYLEVLATKKVYSLIFPKQPTAKDLDIHNKLHYFRLLQPKHLGLQLKQIKPVWELTNKYLSDLNRASSTIKKFQYLKQFMKVINGILLANQQTNKHKIELVVLYALLKSDQKQIASNIHFMEIFTDPARMVSAEGAFVASIKASLRQLEQLTFSRLQDIDEIAYNKQFQKLERELQLRQKSPSVEYIKQ